MNLRVLLLLAPDGLRTELAGLITARFPEIHLHTARDNAQAEPHLDSVEVILSFAQTLTGPLLEHAAELRWIHSLGTGVDGVVDNPALRPEVLLTATRGIHGPAMSEAAFSMMLTLARELSRTFRNQAAHRWERWLPDLLHRKHVGILGVGAVACDLAQRCTAFGMRVTGISRTPRPAAGFDCMLSRAQLLDAVGEFDYLVLTIPYAPDSHHIVNAALLSRMKSSSVLVNIARGDVVDEAALVDSLRTHRIAGAGLDVFATEPLPATSPLWELDNVVLTSHQAGSSVRYASDSFPQIEHNLQAFMQGTPQAMLHRVSH